MSGSSSALSPQSFSPSQNESANTQTFVYGQLTMSNTQRIGAAHAVQQRTTAIRSAMIESWLNVPLDTKQVASETFSPKPNFLLVWCAWKKLNLTQQKHAFTSQKKCRLLVTTQNKHKKTKARFSRLLRHPARKWSGSILKGKDK